MKLVTYLFFLTVLILGFTQCKSSKDVTGITYNDDVAQPFSYKGRMLTFGSGGGFAGRVQEWTLMDDGTLFEGQMVQNIPNGVKIAQGTTDQMFNLYDEYALHEMDINEPGNYYQFIKMVDDNGSHKLTWGGEKIDFLSRYHYTLHQIVKANTTRTPATKSKATR